MKDFISYEPIFVWVMLLCFVSCGGNDTTRISQALFCAEHQKADSALVLLNQINRANLSKEDQAKFSLVYTLAQDKSGIDIYSDSLIGIASGWFKAILLIPFMQGASIIWANTTCLMIVWRKLLDV